MNRSEVVAKSWLEEKHGKGNVFHRANDTPDFVVTGSPEQYEVKLLYGNKTLVFWSRQLPKIKDDTIIIVTDKDKILSTFKWVEREQHPEFNIYVVNTEGKKDIRIFLDTKEHDEFLALKGERSWKQCLRDGVSQTTVKTITCQNIIVEFAPELSRKGFSLTDEVKELLVGFTKFQRRKAGVQ